MLPSNENATAFLENRALLLLLIAVTLALGWILLPFYGTILWASIIALLFAPLHRWLLRRLKERRTPAALLTLFVVIVVVVVPFAILSGALAREAMQVYQQLASGEWDPALDLHAVFDARPAWAMAVLDRLGLVSFDLLERRLAGVLAQIVEFIATHALSISQDTADLVARLFIMLYLAFFLIRDGEDVVSAVRRALPLAPRHNADLLGKFATVIRATINGSLLVAAIQGALGGLAFWCLGISGALLWAVMMAFLSLLPVFGAALVWLPAALYLFITDATWQSLALVAWGMLVIGLVDNLLRPMLVGKDTRMPDYVVMITTLGGLAVLGINGLIVGPAIAAMFIAVWHIYMTAHPNSAESADRPDPAVASKADAREGAIPGRTPGNQVHE